MPSSSTELLHTECVAAGKSRQGQALEKPGLQLRARQGPLPPNQWSLPEASMAQV